MSFKETKSTTMKFFEKKILFSFKIICKSRIKLCFHNKSVLKTAWKSELSYKNRCFSLVGNYLRPSNN